MGLGKRRTTGADRPLLVLAIAALAVAGCSLERDQGAEPPAETQPPPAAMTEATEEPAAPALLAGDEAGATLTSFVEAAGAGNAARMWALLSASTRERLGPTPAAFRARRAKQLEKALGSFARRGAYELILAEPINAVWGVAAVAGERLVQGKSEYAAYAAALRFEAGRWKVELDAPVRLRPLAPDPGATKKAHPQLAVEITAGVPIREGGLWLDGIAFPADGGGFDDKHFTIFGEPFDAVANGEHSVVAFAIAGKSATATAWTFRVRE